MHATTKCPAPDFLKALKLVSRVIEKRSTIPILTKVRITCGNDMISISGTDLDSWVTASLWANTSAPLDFVISPEPLLLALRFASGNITIGEDGDAVTIAADGVTISARKVCKVEDWPSPPTMFDSAFAEISSSKLRVAIGNVSHAISAEETRYYLNGVFLHGRGDAGATTLRSVATDGHRLALFDAREPWSLPDAILPSRAVSILLAALPEKSNSAVTVRGAEKMVSFHCDGWSIVAKCIDGTFPDYRRVIPKPSDKISVAVSPEALRRLPRSAEMVTALTIDPSAGKMSVTGCEREFEVSAPVEGRGPRFGVNIRYIAELARKFGTVRITGEAPGDPLVVIPETPDLTLIVMPMRI